MAEAVKPLLKGECFVLEDDMDIWPYDTGAVLDSIRKLRSLYDENAAMIKATNLGIGLDAITEPLETLENEIRILRGTKEPLGSDIRFPFLAKQAGFTLYGDPAHRIG